MTIVSSNLKSRHGRVEFFSQVVVENPEPVVLVTKVSEGETRVPGHYSV